MEIMHIRQPIMETECTINREIQLLSWIRHLYSCWNIYMLRLVALKRSFAYQNLDLHFMVSYGTSKSRIYSRLIFDSLSGA